MRLQRTREIDMLTRMPVISITRIHAIKLQLHIRSHAEAKTPRAGKRDTQRMDHACAKKCTLTLCDS